MTKGYKQKFGRDYFETFLPVVKPQIVGVVLMLAFSFNWALKQLDVNNAFLNEEFQPLGFEDTNAPNLVCKLHSMN